MKLLRNPEFQELLTNYPRAKRQFIIAHETQDTVTSRIEERYGQQPSAEDYLAAVELWGEAALRAALLQARPGEIDPKSERFWRLRFGLNEQPVPS